MYLCEGVFSPDFVLIPAHTGLDGVLFQTCPDLSLHICIHMCVCVLAHGLFSDFLPVLCVYFPVCVHICLGRVRSVKICVNICQWESVFFFPSSVLSTICLGVGVSFLQIFVT